MNISQEKREKMLMLLSKIKEEKKEDKDVVIALNEIENEIKNMKYGLMWEEHEEEVDKELEHSIPIFSEEKDKEILADEKGKFNFLLEGDNLHSLKLLQRTHKEKIDIIYIDPPYNTKNKDFIYDDNMIGEDDGYRHSKWLSFMQRRLEIAKDLLTDDGVIFISIDDNEQAQLKLLCDNIFGENNFVACMPRVTKKAGKNHGSNISKNHDYILIYMNNLHDCFAGIIPAESKYPFKDEYYDERGGYKLNQTLDYDSLWYNPKMDFEVNINNETFVPGSDHNKYIDRHNGIHNKKDWVWRWSKPKIEFGLNNDFIVIKNNRIYTKTYLNVTIGKNNNKYFVEKKDRSQKYSSLTFLENIFSNDNAKKDLGKIMDSANDFDFPKPVSLVYTILKMYKKNKDSIILDFFAGSGTTGHAVAKLNAEDEGNRTYILCTNNENNICEEVTYKRLLGIQKELPHNLKYFKTDFLEKSDEELLYDLMEHMNEMIVLENGYSKESKKYAVILTDEDMDELEEHISEYTNLERIYMSNEVLLTSKQNNILSNYEIKYISQYYFDNELKEMGEFW